MIKITFVCITTLLTLASCNKSLEGNIETVNIRSPYFEEALIDLGIDSDGTINQLVSKEDIESVEELDIILNIFKDEDNECAPRFDFDFENENLIDGIEEFTNLKKLVLVVRPQPDEEMKRFKFNHLISNDCFSVDSSDVFNVDIIALEALEEIYFNAKNTDFGRGLDVKIQNCPKLNLIGAANPFVGLSDYPSEKIIQFDTSEFLDDNVAYTKFNYLFGGWEAGGGPTDIFSDILISFDFVNLPELTSLHLHQFHVRKLTHSGCPKMKELFLRTRRLEFTSDFYLFDQAFNEIEELYIDYEFNEEFPKYDGRLEHLGQFIKNIL